MPQLLFHHEIYDEVQDSFSWYESKSKGLGTDFINELESAYVAIQQMPGSWSKINKKIYRYLLKRFPYGILYSYNNDTIFIIAVMHLSRKPGYWKERVYKTKP